MRSHLSYWIRRAKEAQAWAAEHPEEAAARDAKIAADELERKRSRLAAKASDASRFLRSMSVPGALADELQAEEERELGGESRKWQTRAMAHARRWLESGTPSLVLLGGVGSGKSAAAAWTLLRLRAQDCGLFVGAAKLARMSKFDCEWDHILEIPRLVVDDLGVEARSDFSQERLFELVNARLDGRLRTVFTSNLGADAIKSRYGRRVESRLRANAQISGVGDVDLRAGAR